MNHEHILITDDYPKCWFRHETQNNLSWWGKKTYDIPKESLSVIPMIDEISLRIQWTSHDFSSRPRPSSQEGNFGVSTDLVGGFLKWSDLDGLGKHILFFWFLIKYEQYDVSNEIIMIFSFYCGSSMMTGWFGEPPWLRIYSWQGLRFLWKLGRSVKFPAGKLWKIHRDLCNLQHLPVPVQAI